MYIEMADCQKIKNDKNNIRWAITALVVHPKKTIKIGE